MKEFVSRLAEANTEEEVESVIEEFVDHKEVYKFTTEELEGVPKDKLQEKSSKYLSEDFLEHGAPLAMGPLRIKDHVFDGSIPSKIEVLVLGTDYTE